MEIHERLNCLRPMDACIVQRHHNLSLDVTQEMLEEPDDVPTTNCSSFRVLKKSPVRSDASDGGELFPVRSERDQGRHAPG